MVLYARTQSHTQRTPQEIPALHHHRPTDAPCVLKLVRAAACFRWDADGDVLHGRAPFEFRCNLDAHEQLGEIVTANWDERWIEEVLSLLLNVFCFVTLYMWVCINVIASNRIAL